MIAELCIMHPEWSVSDVLRAAGFPPVTIAHSGKRAITAPGVVAATAELQRLGYREAMLREVSIEKAAKRIGQLVDSEDGNIALKATVTAMEHAGIVERHDQEKVLVYVQQQFVQQVTPDRKSTRLNSSHSSVSRMPSSA